MTIRRDLAELEHNGPVEKTFGGAVLADQAAHELVHQDRVERQRMQKASIAKFAATLVSDGDTIAIDASTTGLALALQLSERAITVVTNSIDIASALRAGRCEVILTGGFLRRVAGSFVGPMTVQALASIRVDRMFFSAKGVLIPDGFLDSDLTEVEAKRALLRSSAEAIALVDGTKFGVRALGCIAPIRNASLVITDTSADDAAVATLREHGVDVEVVTVAPDGAAGA